MKHSQLAVDFIVTAESTGSGQPHLSVTTDELGRPSVGYGHTVVGGLYEVPLCSDACMDLLLADLSKWEGWINGLLLRPIQQHQFDAILCWAYHVGQGRAQAHGQDFSSSRLMTHAMQGMMQMAAAEFDHWVLVKDRPSKKLVARRQAEKYLFLYGDLSLQPCGSLAS